MYLISSQLSFCSANSAVQLNLTTPREAHSHAYANIS